MTAGLNPLYLFADLLLLLGLLALIKRAPDMIQTVMLVVSCSAALIYISAGILALSGYDPVWPVRVVASQVEHIAIYLYVFRQLWIKSEICRLVKSLPSARK